MSVKAKRRSRQPVPGRRLPYGIAPETACPGQLLVDEVNRRVGLPIHTDLRSQELRLAGLRAAVQFAFETWRSWPPRSEQRAFWLAEIVEAERALSEAQGMPRVGEIAISNREKLTSASERSRRIRSGANGNP